MKNTYINTRIKAFKSVRMFYLFLVFLVASGVAVAQATEDFSTSTAGTMHFVDSGSGAVQHILVNNPPPQTSPNAETFGNTLGYQVLFTPTRTPSAGLTDGELFGVVNVTVPASSDNNMGSLTIDFAANPPPSGNNNVYVLEDPDGLATLRFNPVVVDASTMFSMSYIIANTSYENSDGADDRIAIYLENLADGTRTELFSASNELIPRNEMWATLSQDLSALAGATIQLVVEFDTNASTEEMAIDNISFSSGTVMAGWPMCVNPEEPAVAQFPATVCPGIPFRLTIAGALNNATEWVIYADAAATEEVGRTSSNQFDVFTGAVPGTTYYIRGEGACSDLMTLTPLVVMTDDPANCMPDATPGTSFEEPLGSSGDYFDTGNPAAIHELINNQGQPAVRHSFKAQELGFTTQFIPTRTGTSGEAGLTDGDAVGVSNDSGAAFPDGNQGLVLEDTDGTIVVFLTPVDITGLTDVVVSFDYFVNSTSYEESGTGGDSFAAGIARGFTPLEQMFSALGDGSTGLPGLATGVWTTYNYTITGTYTEPIQLIFQADFDASTEKVFIDNVSFSAGTIVCQDTEAPVVVCPDPIMIDADENCSVVANFEASATDDCSSTVTITYSQDSGTIFTIGETPVTVTATDESGKMSTCIFNVTVNDVTPPTIVCEDFTVQVDSMANCTFVIPDASFDPVAMDNCGTVTLDYNGLPTLTGTILVASDDGFELAWTATDEAGLTATCTSVVTVIVPPNCFPTSVTSQDASDFSAVRATPNPFTAGTTISFELPVNTRVGVEVLDLSGRVLTTDVISPSGNNTYSWYWDAQQAAFPAGVYFARLRVEGSVYTQRLVLMK